MSLSKETMPEIRYELGKQPMKVYQGGRSNEATALNFPISKGLAGVSMFLAPGGLRELHWHANAAEWSYVVSGHCRVTVIDPQGRSEIKDFGPGDVWYFPRGHGHSIQGLGNEECHFILVFDSGYFSEFATFSMSDWLAQTPKEVLAKEFGMPVSAFDKFPRSEVYIAQGPIPKSLPADPPPESQNPPPFTHRFHLGAMTPEIVPGGTFKVVTQKQFPISSTMSGAILKLKPLSIRELHWHPNCDEWQYYIKGRARMTVFGSQGRKITREFEPGDVGYVPMGYGHYIESIGNEDCEMLAVFNSGDYQEVSLSQWLSSNPSYLLQTNLGVSADIVKGLRKKEDLFSVPLDPAKPQN
ncbi:MAG: cupin domain-containing protein [Cyanobacteria bacterium SZAS LIN-3]|nr:cupin domain-containing protein [Cyanobacteria bacterium SZAS LIN-3]MBS2009120.1 cupin domain-containing protein [Cyanobacteria bacterium SZAS TMP-1]